MRKPSKIMPEEAYFIVMTSWMTSQGDLKVAFYIHLSEKLAWGASCKGNISSINANIVIVFLGYTYLKKILINKTFQDRRSTIKVRGLLGDLGTLTKLRQYWEY